MRMPKKATMKYDGHDLLIIVDGLKIAKRGRPNTPQAKIWVSIEPGWKVFDVEDGIEVQHQSVLVQ